MYILHIFLYIIYICIIFTCVYEIVWDWVKFVGKLLITTINTKHKNQNFKSLLKDNLVGIKT